MCSRAISSSTCPKNSRAIKLSRVWSRLLDIIPPTKIETNSEPIGWSCTTADDLPCIAHQHCTITLHTDYKILHGNRSLNAHSFTGCTKAHRLHVHQTARKVDFIVEIRRVQSRHNVPHHLCEAPQKSSSHSFDQCAAATLRTSCTMSMLFLTFCSFGASVASMVIAIIVHSISSPSNTCNTLSSNCNTLSDTAIHC